MMMKNPAWAAFASGIETGLIFGQVLVTRTGTAFELRHVADMESLADALPLLAAEEIRAAPPNSPLTGAFRPLKSAPNLRQGWRIHCPDETALGEALNKIVSRARWRIGTLALTMNKHITGYREYTERQTGMYRITATVDDATAAGAIIRACCHEHFCLKRRLWSVAGLETRHRAENKSMIPCFEPCAILLEFARKMARLAKDEGVVARTRNRRHQPNPWVRPDF